MTKWIVLTTVVALLSSCSAPNSSELPGSAVADQYFYPTVAGIEYVYTQSGGIGDTSTYRAQPESSAYGSYIQLVNQNPAAGGVSVLYYFKVEQTPGLPIKCILSSTGSDQGLVVLQGTLDIGSNWYADAGNSIEATVVGRYADYFPPGQDQIYHDVVVVKYKDLSKTDDSYTIRFFARDYGLILEREVLNPTTDIASLQLIGRFNAPGKGVDQDHDHWYDVHGRFVMKMRDPSEDE